MFAEPGPKFQCFLKVKADLSEVLIFQNVTLNVYEIVRIDVVRMAKDTIVIYRKKRNYFDFSKFETLF